MAVRIITGDCRELLATLPERSVQCVVTSPPYFGLRDYGVSGQLGLEPSLGEYIATMVAVFREVRRVLRGDGTVWLNIGDSYAGSGKGAVRTPSPATKEVYIPHPDDAHIRMQKVPDGLKPKDLMMVPARLAIALQDDGWYLRSDIIWAKKAPMPESVTDRPTSAHEHIFLLTKQARYYYDADAVRERMRHQDAELLATNAQARQQARIVDRAAFRTQDEYRDAMNGQRAKGRGNAGNAESMLSVNEAGRNLRNVWHLGPEPFALAHFATFPTEIPRRCILAGSREGDTVLDPFLGAGTTLLVADRLGRNGIGIELSPEYSEMARRRITNDAPLFAMVAD